jgi:hypothetical protein
LIVRNKLLSRPTSLAFPLPRMSPHVCLSAAVHRKRGNQMWLHSFVYSHTNSSELGNWSILVVFVRCKPWRSVFSHFVAAALRVSPAHHPTHGQKTTPPYVLKKCILVKTKNKKQKTKNRGIDEVHCHERANVALQSTRAPNDELGEMRRTKRQKKEHGWLRGDPTIFDSQESHR